MKTHSLAPRRLSETRTSAARASSARSSTAGFSLAELMVVIVILGLIATVVVPSLLDRFGVAQVKKAEIDIAAIEQAVDQFAVENNAKYPESLEILVTPDQNNRTFLKGYDSVPLDPWGNPYQFEPATGNGIPRIISFGKDGQPGGEGDDADIDNFTIRNKGRK